MCLAVPGKLVKISHDDGDPLTKKGVVDFDGVRRDVYLSYVPDAKIGEYLLIHVGFAISKIPALDAEKIIKDLEKIL